MSVECQVNVKSQSELDIGGRETCLYQSHCTDWGYLNVSDDDAKWCDLLTYSRTDTAFYS